MTQETVLIEHMGQLIQYIKNPIKGVRIIIGFTSLARMNSILQKDLTKTLGTEINGHLMLASDFLRNPDLDIGNWDVSRVTTMKYTFANATGFDRDISKWDTANVTSMVHMFAWADDFNQPLDNWNTASLVSVKGMLQNSAVCEEFIPERLRAIEEKDALLYEYQKE